MNQSTLLGNRQLLFLYIGFFVVYITGLFVPLMQNDSAQHASMAMRMVLTDDYLNLFKGENPYLDKPHLHFWLSALSMKVFGINAIAYRIPALLSIALGAYATKKLSSELYPSYKVGDLSALVFLSSQTIILSAHDVRTDAVLTGLVIFSIWQFLLFIRRNNAGNALLAGIAAGLAFSTKGLMTLVIVSLSIFAYLLYSREWKKFFSLKLLIAACGFLLALVPIFIAYHHQFGEDGIRFILFGQSFQRLTADGLGPNNSDYLFFFHTLLWAFLPFSLAFYFGVVGRIKTFARIRFQKRQGLEFLTVGGFLLVMMIFSFSKFKLPHYLNGLIAVLSVLVAAYLFELRDREKKTEINVLWFIQLIVIFGGVIGVGLLSIYFIPEGNLWLTFLVGLGVGVLLFLLIKKGDRLRKYILCSLVFAIVMNFFLNAQFYPTLTRYQGSLTLAEWVNKEKLDLNKIYMLTGSESWAFDFYTKRNTPRVALEQLKKGDYVVLSSESLREFPLKYDEIRREDDFRITRLSLKFLNPNTRKNQLNSMYLIQVK